MVYAFCITLLHSLGWSWPILLPDLMFEHFPRSKLNLISLLTLTLSLAVLSVPVAPGFAHTIHTDTPSQTRTLDRDPLTPSLT